MPLIFLEADSDEFKEEVVDWCERYKLAPPEPYDGGFAVEVEENTEATIKAIQSLKERELDGLYAAYLSWNEETPFIAGPVAIYLHQNLKHLPKLASTPKRLVGDTSASSDHASREATHSPV